MAKGKIVVITGLPGVGKSTVLSELEKLAKQAGKRVQIVNFGTIMLEFAKKKNKDLIRDEIRLKPVSFQHKLQANAASTIAKMARAGAALIVDTHMMIRTDSGYWAGLPIHVLKKLQPDFFVLIEASPEEILNRRTSDKTRVRDKIKMEDVMEEIMVSRAFASACGVLTGVPFKIIMNPTGKQDEAAEEIVKLL